MPRPDWDLYAVGLAQAAAVRATCTRRQVGTVILDDRHRVVATGYNGSAPGQSHCTDVGCLMVDDHCRRTTHAEANAIRTAWERGQSVKGCTIVTTAQPCSQCASLIASAGIVRVVYQDGYPDDLTGQIFAAAGIALERRHQ